jgi:hypothetical protein
MRDLVGNVLGYAAIAVCTAGAILNNSGCTATDGDTEENLATQSQLVTDPTGKITISITQCAATGLAPGEQSTTCPVASGFVLIGGGGQVLGRPSPGDLLQRTEPSGQGWFVLARDLVHESSYQLRAAAIGLQLDGVSQSALASMVAITSAVGPTGHSSTATAASPNSDFIVIGGGARAVANANQHSLVASMPLTDSTGKVVSWAATSKDHVNSDPGFITSFAISIPRCPAGFTGGCLATNVASASSGRGTGYQDATVTTTGAVSGVGAQAIFSNAGRLLTTIWPTDTGIANQTSLLAVSKDHIVADSGSSVAYQVLLRATPN